MLNITKSLHGEESDSDPSRHVTSDSEYEDPEPLPPDLMEFDKSAFCEIELMDQSLWEWYINPNHHPILSLVDTR